MQLAVERYNFLNEATTPSLRFIYLTDEWGRILYQEVIVPAVKDQEGNIIIPEHTETQPILNFQWDGTKEYIPRTKRPEWVVVGLLGQIQEDKKS